MQQISSGTCTCIVIFPRVNSVNPEVKKFPVVKKYATMKKYTAEKSSAVKTNTRKKIPQTQRQKTCSEKKLALRKIRSRGKGVLQS